MKRVALRGNWDTPPTPMYRKWEVSDANTFIHRLSLDKPTSPKRAPLDLQTTLDEWASKDVVFYAPKEISPTFAKSVANKNAAALASKSKPTPEPPVRRKVGFAICGEGEEHSDPCKQASETHSRITTIVKTLQMNKDLEPFVQEIGPAERTASDPELLTVHTKGYLSKLNKITASANPSSSGKDKDRQINNRAVEEFDSVYMTAGTFDAARKSAAAAMDCVEAVCQGQLQVAAAAIRPPGHHAEAHCAMGFCFFNNAALAAKKALDLGMRKVLIVDQDIHHGNGTQRAFWDDERVLYFSVHRWDKGRFYPHNEIESSSSCIGPKDGSAAGKTMNVAFCDGEMGDLEYRAVWESILIPVAKEFKPDIIIFSAGFDAAEGDPIGKYHVSPLCFGAMISSLCAVCPLAKAVLLLEGGYNTTATAHAFCECVRALTYATDASKNQFGTEWPNISQWRKVKQQAIDAINETVKHQSMYWPCLTQVGHNPANNGLTVFALAK